MRRHISRQELNSLPFVCAVTIFPVAISEGSHPFPSRTRKLSPPEPMVLRGKPRGRVGRRRIFLDGRQSLSRGWRPSPFVSQPPVRCCDDVPPTAVSSFPETSRLPASEPSPSRFSGPWEPQDSRGSSDRLLVALLTKRGRQLLAPGGERGLALPRPFHPPYLP
jgi:hypothetical protein